MLDASRSPERAPRFSTASITSTCLPVTVLPTAPAVPPATIAASCTCHVSGERWMGAVDAAPPSL